MSIESSKSLDYSESDSISLTESVDGFPHKEIKKKKKLRFFRHKHVKEEKSNDHVKSEKVSGASEDSDRTLAQLDENGEPISRLLPHAESRDLSKTDSPHRKRPTQHPNTHKLQVKLRSGEDLAARDSNGKSDPYVKFKVEGKTVYKSRCCKETLNPIWDEEFEFPVHLQSNVTIVVFDKDLVLSDDFIGGGILDLSSLEQKFTDVTIHLEDPDCDEELGYIHLEMRLLPLSNDRENIDLLIGKIPLPIPMPDLKLIKEDFKSRRPSLNQSKRAGSVNSRSLPPVAIATIQLVSGNNLPAKDTNGFSDPYVKLCLGKTKRKKSKVCVKTLNPIWKEEYTFYLTSFDTSLLEVTVWDHDTYKKDDFIGRTELDLWSLQWEVTHPMTLNLVDTNGSLLFLVTVHEIEPDEKLLTSYDLGELRLKYGLKSTLDDLKDVGFAEIRIISASDLKSADINGKSDPFCVVTLCNARAQTQTCNKTLDPVWNRVFTFPLHDVHDVFNITIFDQDQNCEKEFLGRIEIPVLRCCNGKVETYALKDRKLKERAKGTITLQINYIFNPVRAAIRTLTPREEIYMEEAKKFKKDLLIQNFSRVWRIVQHFITTAEFINSFFIWESKARSAVAFWMFLIIVWNFELYMLPVVLLMLLMKNYVDIFLRKTRPPRHLMNAEEAQRASGEDEDDEEEASSSKSTGIIRRLRAVEEVLTKVQNILDAIASFGERLYNSVTWSVPFLAWLLATVLVIVAVILYFIPLRAIVILWGINKFTKRLRNPNYVSNNEVVDFLSRVPSNIELDKHRELSIEPISRGGSKKKR